MQVRKLGHRETLCKLAHEHCGGTGLITFYCRLNGLLDVNILTDALSLVVKNCPVLNLTFNTDDTQHFHQLNIEPGQPLKKLPISVLKNKSETDWQEIFEQENNKPLAFSDDYLWRILLLNNLTSLANKHDIIASFHHAIFDSRSFLVFIEKWFLAYESIQSKRDGIQKGIMIDCLESSIEQKVSRNRYMLKQLRYITKSWPIKKPKLKYEFNAHLSQRRSKNIFADIQNVQGLVQNCREQSVTLGALLAAVLLKSVVNNIQALNRFTRCGLKLVTAIDFRNKLTVDEAKELMGMYVSSAYSFHSIAKGSDIWSIAKNYARELEPAIERCIIPEEFFPNRLLKNFTKRAVASTGHFTSGISLSNIGRVNFSKSNFHISDLRFCSNRQIGDFLVNINALSLNGKLRLTCTFVEPLLDEKIALDIVSELVGALEKARDFSHGEHSGVQKSKFDTMCST